jgi:hypothetical protein
MLLLERLSPLERASFLLHDVFSFDSRRGPAAKGPQTQAQAWHIQNSRFGRPTLLLRFAHNDGWAIYALQWSIGSAR